MNRFERVLVFLTGLFFLQGTSVADILRDPIGVNVSAARPMSLTVRFASSDGTRFTTDQALFCYRQLASGQCDPAAILGRLPGNRDRGSTREPVSSITDVMTIPYSVIRSTLAIAQNVDFSDFYYVRRFIPEPGEDIGAGVDQPVYQKVTCHLAGPARVPLSLTKVSIFAIEPYRDERVKLLRLNQDNLDTGKLFAEVEHTGTGVVEGWWEIRRPGEPELRDIDLVPAAALPPAQRGTQNRYFRVKRFRVRATTVGTAIIEGPKYSELPRDISGRHEILLRFAAGSGRENRARLNVPGEPLNVFSGSVAAFRIPPLEYHVPADLSREAAVALDLSGKLRAPDADSPQSEWQLAWRMPGEADYVVQLKIDRQVKALIPASAGLFSIPSSWMDAGAESLVTLDLLGPDGSILKADQLVVIP